MQIMGPTPWRRSLERSTLAGQPGSGRRFGGCWRRKLPSSWWLRSCAVAAHNSHRHAALGPWTQIRRKHYHHWTSEKWEQSGKSGPKLDQLYLESGSQSQPLLPENHSKTGDSPHIYIYIISPTGQYSTSARGVPSGGLIGVPGESPKSACASGYFFNFSVRLQGDQ